jgi:hypothetical protein
MDCAAAIFTGLERLVLWPEWTGHCVEAADGAILTDW